MSYYYVLEGKIARYISSENNVPNPPPAGLCTNNITTCCIIVLISQDRNRYVMIHADSSLIGTTWIQEQIVWAEVDCHKFVFRRSDSLLFNKLGLEQLQFNVQLIPEDQEFVFIQTGTVLPRSIKIFNGKIEYHPHSPSLYAHHQLTGMYKGLLGNEFNNEIYLSPMLYINAWQEYQDYKISCLISENIEYFQLTSHSCYDLFKVATDPNTNHFSEVPNIIVRGCGMIGLYHYLLANPKPPLEFRPFIADQARMLQEHGNDFGERSSFFIAATRSLGGCRNKETLPATLKTILKYWSNNVNHAQTEAQMKKFFTDFIYIIMNVEVPGSISFSTPIN